MRTFDCSGIVDCNMETIGQPFPHGRRCDEDERALGIDRLPPVEESNRAPYPTRLRVVLALSLVAWAVVALAIAWAIGQF